MKFEKIILKLKEKGFKASKKNNSKFSIKTNANYKEILKILKQN